MNNNKRSFAATGAEFIYVIALNIALFMLICMISLSGSSVHEILASSGVKIMSVLTVEALVFAVSAALAGGASFALKKLNG